MLLMFWVGSFWREDEAPQPVLATPAAPTARSRHRLAPLVVLGLAVTAAVLGPALAQGLQRGADKARFAALPELEAVRPDWQPAVDPRWSWAPNQPGADRERDQYYRSETGTVGLFLRQYLRAQGEDKLVQTASPWRPYGDRGTWRVSRQAMVSIADVDREPLRLLEGELIGPGHRLLVWSWYRIDGRYTGQNFVAKLLETQQQILRGRREGTRIFLATAVSGDTKIDHARRDLQAFLDQHWVAIERALDSREPVGSSEPTGGGNPAQQL